jgi:uncharacterized protein YegP (UPF0339 family)
MIEIVRTDAEQPWHVRLVAGNGQVVWHTENYADRDSAASAVAVAAEAFGITMNRPPSTPDDDTDGLLGEAPDGRVYAYPFRFVDERDPDAGVEQSGDRDSDGDGIPDSRDMDTP